MFFASDPEEARAMMEKMAEQQEMAQDVALHEVERFFDSLDKEQLTALRIVVRGTHTEGYVEYVAGLIGGILRYKYNVCGCGRDHDAELLAGSSSSETPEQIEERISKLEPSPEEEAQYLRDLEVYTLVQNFEGGRLNYKCTGCGMEYQSLEDRKLRDPGVKGCEGCQHKAKWG